eukprot:m.373038 g.373038  ORF g.373038 m.373038 type:complete len:65 (-) comp65710_c0_seq1:2-196(-)
MPSTTILSTHAITSGALFMTHAHTHKALAHLVLCTCIHLTHVLCFSQFVVSSVDISTVETGEGD